MIDRDWIMRLPASHRGPAITLVARLADKPVVEDARALLSLACTVDGDEAQRETALHLALDIADKVLMPLVPVEAHLAAAHLLTSAGRTQEALTHARMTVRLAPDAGATWFALSAALTDAGDHSPALMAMVRAVRADYAHQGPWRADLFQLWLTAMGEDQPRYAEIMKPCPVFGRLQPTLDSKTEAIIEAIVDAHARAFENGDFQPPSLMSAPVPGANGSLKLLLVQNEFINGKADHIRNDIADIYAHSARLNGIDVSRSQAADAILYDPDLNRSPAHLAEGLAVLAREIENLKPDIVMMDGNFLGHPGTIQPDFFSNSTSRSYRLVVTIPDLYDRKPNVFDYWGTCADAVVVLNARTTHVEASAHRDKALYWPGLPFDERMFGASSRAEKSTELAIIGSLNRGRELFAKIMEGIGFPGDYLIHDRSAVQALSTEAYYALLARSRMVFNNGVISANQRIVTGRVFEAIYAGSLLLEESGSDIDRLFLPWVHYLPFANIHQFVSLCQYVQKHPGTVERIQSLALDWTRRHFSGPQFWAALRHRLAI